MFKKAIWLFLILALALGPACVPPSPSPVTPTQAPELETLTILHTNDYHGAIAPEIVRVGNVQFESGGLANLVGHIDYFRKEAGGKALVLDAGDIWQGTFASNQTKGATMIEAMNIAGYDAAAVGNHDLDFGWEVLRDRAAQAKFPFLAANLVEEATGKAPPYVQPYLIKQVGNLKVGIIGLTYPGGAAIIKASAIKGLKFLDGVESIQKYLPEVKPRVDILVVLSHLGMPGDEDLAARVKGIDVIVGGHTHIEQRYTKRVGDTLIVQAGSKGKVLGKLELVYDRIAKKIVKYTTANELVDIVNTKIPANPQVAALVKQRLEEAKEVLNRPIGQTLIDLEPCYEGECPLGNLVADAMLAVNLTPDRPADAAMHNNSGLRARLPAGNITFGQLYEVLPFDNTLVSIDLTGEQILAILERTVSGRRGNLVVSGMTYQYDWSKPAGSRIVAVTIGGKPLDPKKTYRIQTIDYLATGGDGQTTFTQGKIVAYGDPIVEIVAEYIKKHSPVNPKVEGRITGK